MRLGITGTYSSGKTFTTIALGHYTGLPRTRAKTMREILPDAAPGKTLEQCTAAELLQMIVVRHTERAVHEARLAPSFLSDGCSLQEWIYGRVRVTVGINPNDSIGLSELESVEKTPELACFEQVVDQLGLAFKRHVKSSYDAFVHLRNELPLAVDGHRPVNDRFRTMSDELLLQVLDELAIPYTVVSGSVAERLREIVALHDLPTVMSVEDALVLAEAEYAGLDVRSEAERTAEPVGAGR